MCEMEGREEVEARLELPNSHYQVTSLEVYICIIFYKYFITQPNCQNLT